MRRDKPGNADQTLSPTARERFYRDIDVIRKDPEKLFAHLEDIYRGGRHKKALADMIYYCCQLGEPLPPWAAEAFVTGYQKFRSGQIESWDGVPGRQGNMRTVKKSSKAYSVWARCRQLHGPARPIGDGLFETVGKEFGIKKTHCSKLYYKFEEIDKKLRGAEQLGIIPPVKTSAKI